MRGPTSDLRRQDRCARLQERVARTRRLRGSPRLLEIPRQGELRYVRRERRRRVYRRRRRVRVLRGRQTRRRLQEQQVRALPRMPRGERLHDQRASRELRRLGLRERRPVQKRRCARLLRRRKADAGLPTRKVRVVSLLPRTVWLHPENGRPGVRRVTLRGRRPMRARGPDRLLDRRKNGAHLPRRDLREVTHLQDRVRDLDAAPAARSTATVAGLLSARRRSSGSRSSSRGS